MRRRFGLLVASWILLGLFGALIVGPAPVARAGTPVAGPLPGNATWTLADSPVWVEGTVWVPAGVTLTVEAGVEVRFNGPYDLVVNGTLEVQGTAAMPAVFTSNRTAPGAGDWGQITLQGVGSSVAFANITYGFGCLQVLGDANDIVATGVSRCAVGPLLGGSGNLFLGGFVGSSGLWSIRVAGSDNAVRNGTILADLGSGVSIGGVRPVVEGNAVSVGFATGFYGLELRSAGTTEAVVRGNTVRGSGGPSDTGIILAQGVDATFEGNTVEGFGTGLQASDATFRSTNDTFRGNAVDLLFADPGNAQGIALNDSFDPAKVVFQGNAVGSSLTTRWFLDVNVTDLGGRPVAGATVSATDALGGPEFTGTTGADGHAPWIRLRESVRSRTFWVNYTPHTLGAVLLGPDGVNGTVLMDRSKAVTLALNDDRLAPRITNVTATPDPQEQFLAVNVTASVQDATLASVRLNVTYPDATWSNVSMNASGGDGYYVTRPYDQIGLHAFRITAVDTFGNLSTADGTFRIIAPVGPRIANVTAAPDPQEVGGLVNVSATVTDADGIAAVALDVTAPDGTRYGFAMIHGSGDTWYMEAAYPQLGLHTFVITARDRAPVPRTSQANGTFRTVDTTPPVADAGPDRVVVQGATVAFDGSGSTDNVGIVNYTWTFTDVTPQTLYGVSPSYTFLRLGTYAVTLFVRDASGNVGSDAMQVQVRDVTPPQILGFAAAPSPAEVPGTTNVSFAVAEANAVAVAAIEGFDPTGASLGNRTAAYDAGSGRYFAVWSLAALGTYSFVAYAEDESGNWDADTLTVLGRDTAPPAVTGVGAVPSVQEVLRPVVLWAEVSDPFLASVSVEVRDQFAGVANLTMAFNATTGRYEASYVPIALLAHDFRVWAFDTSGNAGTRADAFLSQDTTAPTVSGFLASPRPQEVGLPVNVSVVAADNYRIAQVLITIFSPTGAPVATAAAMAFNPADGRFYDVRPYPEVGTYAVTITALDYALNRASLGDAVVTVDTTPPVVSDLETFPFSWEVGGTITVNATATDNVAVRRVSLQVRNPSGAEVGNHTMTRDPDGRYRYARAYGLAGTYTLRVWAEDPSRNFGFAETTLRIAEGSGPTANAGEDVAVDAGASVGFDGTASTDDYGIVRYAWTFEYLGSRITRTGATFTHRFDVAGRYEVTLTVWDSANRSASDVVVVTVREPAQPGAGLLDLWPVFLIAALLAAVAAGLAAARRRAARRRGAGKPPAEPRKGEPAPPERARREPERPEEEELDKEVEAALEELEELERL